ncbi:MAG TPA: tetratricopeptide repeat protein [Thermodesulfobacteriota bacterium]|nr:tetratricopeptide repeat protein [Thermodesulfobacteriota bacterium]
MGREQRWAWKYVYFCIASLICLSLFGCPTTQQVRPPATTEQVRPPDTTEHVRPPDQAQAYVLRGQTLLSQRNYDGALSEFQKVLSLPPDKPLKDEALFDMGLVYAHFGNPHRDVEKSVEFFKKLINQYPKSTLAEQAKMWVGILEENEKLNQVIQRMKQVDIEIEEMRRKRTP